MLLLASSLMINGMGIVLLYFDKTKYLQKHKEIWIY